MFQHLSQSQIKNLSNLKLANLSGTFPAQIHWIHPLCMAETSAELTYQLHQHSFYELHLLFEGSAGWKDINGSIYNISSGQGVLFPLMNKHQLTGFGPNTFRLTLAFTPENGSHFEQALSCNNHILRFEITARITDCIEKLFYSISHLDLFSHIQIYNSICDIIIETTRTFYKENPAEYQGLFGDNHLVSEIRQFIADNPEKLLSCKEIANYCHFNPKYLSRIFASRTGVSLKDYITAEKIKCAENLLQDKSLSLEQISEMLGFSNESHFSNFFKRANGLPPGQFRSLMK